MYKQHEPSNLKRLTQMKASLILHIHITLVYCLINMRHSFYILISLPPKCGLLGLKILLYSMFLMVYYVTLVCWWKKNENIHFMVLVFWCSCNIFIWFSLFCGLGLVSLGALLLCATSMLMKHKKLLRSLMVYI